MGQLYKRFTKSEVKEFIECYLRKKIERRYIQEVLGIGKIVFFALINSYRHSPRELSIPMSVFSQRTIIERDCEAIPLTIWF